MPSERTETITIAKTIRRDVYDGDQIVGQITGRSRIDEQERWVVELSLMEPSGRRGVIATEGETFEFAGATWQVVTVYEPNTRPRGSVAKLVRLSSD